jgi:general secretion pathway protein G
MRSILQGWPMIGASRKRESRSAQIGFTIIELMIVIAIILILIGMAVGRYDKSVMKSREAVLAHNLQIIRQAIDNYTLDKQNAPQSLDDLVQAGYLRDIPVDPMTQQKDWQTKFGDTVLTPDQVTVGIEDVHSNSERTSPFEGTVYNTW